MLQLHTIKHSIMCDQSSWKIKKRVHVLAVDGIVNVNSLFTIAVFLGLAFIDTKTTLINSPKTCIATSSVAQRMITRHVYSFSSFLFSTMIASALKLALKTEHHPLGMRSAARVNVAVLRAGMMSSSLGSVFGCGFLMLALVDLVEIKFGVWRCWGGYGFAAVVPLVTLVPFSLIVYVCLGIYAFSR